MKSFIAVALANAHALPRERGPFAVHFAFSYEEEIGCFGVKELIADMRDAGIAAGLHRGRTHEHGAGDRPQGRVPLQVLRARGKEAHSSLTPKSVNAIEMAARVIGKVRDMAEGFERDEPRYEGFDVPFSTASVGQFYGGIADNVVPRDAEFRYEFRDLPTADAKRMQQEVLAYARSLEPAMKKVAPDAGFSFDTICEIPSFLGSANDAITQARAAPRGRGGHHAGGLRHRGRPVQERRHPHGGVRLRQHRAGAPARRVREPRPARALRAVHAPLGVLAGHRLNRAALTTPAAEGDDALRRMKRVALGLLCAAAALCARSPVRCTTGTRCSSYLAAFAERRDGRRHRRLVRGGAVPPSAGAADPATPRSSRATRTAIGAKLAGFICNNFPEHRAGAREAARVRSGRPHGRMARAAGQRRAARRMGVGGHAATGSRPSTMRACATSSAGRRGRAREDRPVAASAARRWRAPTAGGRHHALLDGVLEQIAGVLDGEEVQAHITEADRARVKTLRFVGLDQVAARPATRKIVAAVAHTIAGSRRA